LTAAVPFELAVEVARLAEELERVMTWLVLEIEVSLLSEAVGEAGLVGTGLERWLDGVGLTETSRTGPVEASLPSRRILARHSARVGSFDGLGSGGWLDPATEGWAAVGAIELAVERSVLAGLKISASILIGEAFWATRVVVRLRDNGPCEGV
jgi:hypothetical protein